MSFLSKLATIAGIESDGKSVSIPGFRKNIGRGVTFYADAANGSATGNAKTPTTALNSLALAYAKLTTGRHDKIDVLASGSSLNLAASLTWSKNLCHLWGEGSFGRMNQRSRIGHSANFTPMITVSGYGNSFHNLYFMHGRGNAGNLVGISVTGERNSFINCHFGGPMHATEADTSGYKLVNVAATENYFKSCVFGVDSISWDDGYAVYIATGGDNSQRLIFEDCIFLMNAAATPAVYFIGTQAGLGEATAFFLNCQFVNSGTSLTYAIDGAGLGNYQLFFDNRCTFAGVDDIVASTYENYVWCGCTNFGGSDWITGGAALKLGNLLSSHPDVS